MDSHTLFIDAEGTEEQLEKADTELQKIGYLQSNANKTSIVLLEFRLRDVPGSVTDILTLINDFNFNISYISSQENGTDYQHHIAFTGDIYINTHGLTPEQAKYNQYAPILMTSVDTDAMLCAEERKAIIQRLGVGDWQIFGAHGFKKDYSVNT